MKRINRIILAAGLPLADTTLTFASWTASTGSYVARCSVYQTADQVRSNDVVSAPISPSGRMRP